MCVCVCVCVCGLRIENRVSRFKNHVSRIENRVSRIDNCVSRIDNRVLRIENRISRIENRISRIENRISRIKDQGSGFNTELCPLWLSIFIDYKDTHYILPHTHFLHDTPTSCKTHPSSAWHTHPTHAGYTHLRWGIFTYPIQYAHKSHPLVIFAASIANGTYLSGSTS